ncbi:MAG: 3-dehydroquinate synthase II [Thermodesulfobacteriota bacterium]
MRKVWVQVDPWDKALITTALEGGADGIVVPPGHADDVKALGRIDTIAEDGDLKIGEDVVFFNVTSGEDEEEIVRLSQRKKVILTCSDWTIIPLENLIAKGADVIVAVRGIEAAETAFGILEKGVDHILYIPTDVADLKNALGRIKAKPEEVALETAEITEVRPLGMGDRVCVDTCTEMVEGEGMLVGNSSSALFLVHSESVVNPYVAARPFRVNAGPVHAYTRVPGGKTRYLSELAAGDPVLLINYKGEAVVGIVGRLKIEKRPLMLVRARAGGREINAIVQNAETIRLTTPEGKPVSVAVISPGDKVLVAVEDSGRHFGMKIDEQITEK